MSLADVLIKVLKEFSNEQGSVQHMLRADDSEFYRGFGEIYFSTINPSIIKGWHCHRDQISVLSCVHGSVLLVLHHAGKFREVQFGDGQRRLVLIPAGIDYAWQNRGPEPAILANCSTHVYDPAKNEKRALDDIHFNWPT